MTTTEDVNEALVIEAFDTLFNRRDHARRSGRSALTPAGPPASTRPSRRGRMESMCGPSAGLPESALAIEQLAAFVKLHAWRDGAEAGVP